jgi:hypothetical protein
MQIMKATGSTKAHFSKNLAVYSPFLIRIRTSINSIAASACIEWANTAFANSSRTILLVTTVSFLQKYITYTYLLPSAAQIYSMRERAEFRFN